MSRALVAVAALALLSAPVGAEPEAPRLVVCLQPLGAHDARLVPIVRRGIEHLYGVDTAVLRARPMPKQAYYKPRRRWRADKVLAYLDRAVVPKNRRCDRVIGFTRLDVSTSKPPHKDWGIFGLATLGGPSGVVSTYRLRRRAGPTLLAKRAVKVVNHELGHTLGADHIAQVGCLMEDGAGTIKTVDRETGLLCQRSREVIERASEVRLPALERFDWRRVLGR